MTEAGAIEVISDEEEEGADIKLPGVRQGVTCVCVCVCVCHDTDVNVFEFQVICVQGKQDQRFV